MRTPGRCAHRKTYPTTDALWRGLWITGIAALLAAGTPVPANALPGSVTPSISIEQAYDSNVFDAAPGNEQEDFILRVRPAVSFAFPAIETAVNLYLAAETDTYYNNTELSNYPATWIASLTSLKPVVVSPSVSLAPRGYYLETYDSSRRSQLVFSPEAPAIPIEIAQFPQTHTRDYGASLVASYQAAARYQAALTGAYNRHEIITDNTGQADYYTYLCDLSLSYLSGPRSTIGIFGSAGETTYSNDLVSTTYSVGLQGTYAFSESFNVEGRIGESFLRDKPGNGLPEKSDQAPTARLSLNYKLRDFFATAWGSYGYSSGSSLGETTLQGNAGLSFGDQFANGWWWGLNGSYQANRNIDNPSVKDLISANGTAEIRYVPVQWATLRLSSTFYREWAQTDTGSDMKKMTAFLGVTLSKAYSLY